MSFEQPFWNQPSGIDVRQAMDELGLEDSDLEEVEEANNIPVGKYANLDCVFELAHKIADES